ncbi:hypothetical protein BDV93DRAFT_405475, partial [Ceratobasidium sp. AG-I]
EATGVVPYQYQVDVTASLFSGMDVHCVARTGSGKTFVFVMICSMRLDAIIWIVLPLNFIGTQQNKQFRAWGFCRVNPNAST